MRSWLKVVLITAGVFFIILSLIFFLAAFSPFDLSILVEAIVLFVIGSIPIGIVVIAEMRDKPAPINITNKIEIDAGDLVGGDKSFEKLKCRNCGGSLTSRDVRFTDIGMIVNCPYCDQVYAIEEEPKW
jgi:hypothetical protein